MTDQEAKNLEVLKQKIRNEGKEIRHNPFGRGYVIAAYWIVK